MYEIFVQLCKEKGVTTYQVCKETGISQGTISNWKNRGNGISGRILKKLSEYFGVSMEYIMGSERISYSDESHVWDENDSVITNLPNALIEALNDREMADKIYKYADMLIEIKEMEKLTGK